MSDNELFGEVKLATRIYFIKKYIPKAILITVGYVFFVVLAIALLVKVGRPSRFPVLLPFATLILYPIILWASFKDMKDKFYARSDEEVARDLDSIVQAYKASSSYAKGQAVSAYSLFDRHYKLFIFLAILFVAFAILLK